MIAEWQLSTYFAASVFDPLQTFLSATLDATRCPKPRAFPDRQSVAHQHFPRSSTRSYALDLNCWGKPMHLLIKTLAAIAATGAWAAAASAQTAYQSGATPYIEIKNEPPAKLIVDPPLPEGLPKGLVWIQYHAENVRIGPVLSENALKVSPRVGHLHITVDDLPWLWADTSNSNTIDIFGLPPGPHKVTIDLVDANHNLFPGQRKVVSFTMPNWNGGHH